MPRQDDIIIANNSRKLGRLDSAEKPNAWAKCVVWGIATMMCLRDSSAFTHQAKE
jgi:hypothetical protein